MKVILSAPFMQEMIRTASLMYDHGWDERNGGNISLMLDESEIREYLDPESVLRTIPTGFTAPELNGKCFLVTVQSKEKLYFCKRNEKKTYMTNLNAYYYFYFYFANTL